MGVSGFTAGSTDAAPYLAATFNRLAFEVVQSLHCDRDEVLRINHSAACGDDAVDDWDELTEHTEGEEDLTEVKEVIVAEIVASTPVIIQILAGFSEDLSE